VIGEAEPWDVVQATEAENLWVLPCGPVPNNPAELLTSTSFEEFLDMARSRYDYVLLDTPPVLAVADPCIVAPRVDGVIMVVRVSKDTRPQAIRAKELLESVGAGMIGTIVNASEASAYFGSKRFGYGQQYGYGYGYGNASAADYYTADIDANKNQSLAMRK
jgi:succinoglycan biosynthesis transport protein ExoP